MLETEHNCIFHPPNIGYIFIQSFNNTDSISCSSSPCLNGATCINTLGGFKCQCGPGWAGDICQTGKEEELLFVSRFLNTDTNNNNSWIHADIQPPVMSDCQNSETILTSQPEAIASWRIPSFHDPMGNPLSVFTNYPSSNSSSFPWGDFTVQYSALKLSNGLREECNFTISVRRTCITKYTGKCA